MLKPNDTYFAYLTRFSFCILIVFTFSCKRTPTSPSDAFPPFTSAQFHNVVLSVVDYDVVHITHAEAVDFRSTNIARIALGAKDSTTFTPLLSVPSTYDANANDFILHFDYTVALDSAKTEAPLTIRYYSPDSSYSDVDTVVDLLHYPYASAQVFATNSIFPQLGVFQDIDRVGDIFYFHGYGPDGLNKYDLTTRQSALLYPYPSGDHIAADSSYVYCDVGHDHIDRYNVLTGAIDRSFLSFAPNWLNGLALYQQQLFVLEGMSNDALTLKIFNLDGSVADTVPFPAPSYYMTVYDSVVYGVNLWTEGPNEITRFDLRTRSFLPNLLSPAKSCDGIKVFGDQIYFCNFWKDFVGVMPIADLRPAQTTPTHTTISRDRSRAPNQSLKLTAKAWVQSRNAQKMKHY